MQAASSTSRLALPQVPGIRAKQQPNEGGGWVRHRIRL